MVWLGVLRRNYRVGFLVGCLAMIATFGGLLLGIPFVLAGEWLAGGELGDAARLLLATALGAPPVLGRFVRHSPWLAAEFDRH